MTFTNDQFRLDGKVAIVTGAGGRGNSIGRAYALGLANAGAAIVVADLNGAGAQIVAEEINAGGGKAIGVAVDVTDEAATLALAAAATEAFGGVDILINNAALMVDISYDNCETVSLEAWNRAFAVNVNGALLCSRAVIPSMRARRRADHQPDLGRGISGRRALRRYEAGSGRADDDARQAVRQGQYHLQRHRAGQCDIRRGQNAGARRFAVPPASPGDLRHTSAGRA